MSVSIFQVHRIFQVVEGVTVDLALLGFHQFGGAATAGGSNHFSAQSLTHGNSAAQLGEVVLFIHFVHHEAHGLIAVNQVVKHHPRPIAHLHLRPASGIEEGEAAIRALVRLQPCRRPCGTSPQYQHQHAAQEQAGEGTEQLHQSRSRSEHSA